MIWDEDKVKAALEMRAAGKTGTQIGKHFGVSRCSAISAINRATRLGLVIPPVGHGKEEASKRARINRKARESKTIIPPSERANRVIELLRQEIEQRPVERPPRAVVTPRQSTGRMTGVMIRGLSIKSSAFTCEATIEGDPCPFPTHGSTLCPGHRYLSGYRAPLVEVVGCYSLKERLKGEIERRGGICAAADRMGLDPSHMSLALIDPTGRPTVFDRVARKHGYEPCGGGMYRRQREAA